MASLQYQVIVVHQGRSYSAHLFDLKCEAIGASAAEVVAGVQAQAAKILSEYEDETLAPPLPCDLSIVGVELPVSGRGQQLNDAHVAPDDAQAS
jgi:hypothetical protein